MRWFLAYWITVVICLIFAGIYALIGADIAGLSTAFDGILAGGPPPARLVPVLISAVYLFVRVVLHRVLAYTESAIEASPRGDGVRGRRRAAIGNAAYSAFGNPTGLWLSPFALILGAAGALSVFLRFGLNTINAAESLLLSLMVLYAVVTAAAMSRPDHLQRLRYVDEDSEVDPILEHPDEGATTARKRRGFSLRRRTSAAPPNAPGAGEAADTAPGAAQAAESPPAPAAPTT